MRQVGAAACAGCALVLIAALSTRELLLSGRSSRGRRLGTFSWHANNNNHPQQQPQTQPQQATSASPVSPTINPTEATPGKQCEYRCHFDWYDNCKDAACYDCIGCVQLRAPRPPPRPKAPPPPTPLQVPRPVWCTDLSGRGDALMQTPPLFCYQLSHEVCSKFYVRFHGISVPCIWFGVRTRPIEHLSGAIGAFWAPGHTRTHLSRTCAMNG
jgi:hypothetical protein